MTRSAFYKLSTDTDWTRISGDETAGFATGVLPAGTYDIDLGDGVLRQETITAAPTRTELLMSAYSVNDVVTDQPEWDNISGETDERMIVRSGNIATLQQGGDTAIDQQFRTNASFIDASAIDLTTDSYELMMGTLGTAASSGIRVKVIYDFGSGSTYELRMFANGIDQILKDGTAVATIVLDPENKGVRLRRDGSDIIVDELDYSGNVTTSAVGTYTDASPHTGTCDVYLEWEHINAADASVGPQLYGVALGSI